MSVQYAILGILSCQSLTGYDIKKVMQASPFMYWSGNNNQIYKVLVELLTDDLVTNELRHQEGAPSKKIYAITDKGLAKLKEWSSIAPDVPEFKKPFLVQLAWTWQLSHAKLAELLDQYQRDVMGHMLTAHNAAGNLAPQRTEREKAIWELIHQNVIGSYQYELAWIKDVRETIAQFPQEDDPSKPPAIKPNNEENGEHTMEHEYIPKGTAGYVHMAAPGKRIQTEQDGLDMVAACAQHGTNLLLIDAARLSDAFFQLKTGVAGAVMQKLAQYNIKVAIVFDPQHATGKLKDYLTESNRGNWFHTYARQEEAERWLLSHDG